MKQITIAGNIGRDAELRRTNDGTAVAGFSVAVSEGRDKPTTWFDASVWGKRGEALCQYLSKGTRVCVSGELSTREHEGKTYLQVRADQVTLLGGGQERQQGGQNVDPRRGDYQAQSRMDDNLDDEVPF